MSLFKDFIISPDHVVNLGLRVQEEKEKRGDVGEILKFYSNRLGFQ